MKKIYTLFSKNVALHKSKEGFYPSDKPGQFAAVTTQKIVGRLDCHSGKRAKPENRIFLRYLEDKPKGFRFCKICRPEILRVHDRLDYQEKRAETLQSKPHVSLWGLGKMIDGIRYDPCRWYVAMNQEGKSKEWLKNQVTLSGEHRYHHAFSLALEQGRRLNLPVIKHGGLVDFVIIWLPKQKSTPEQTALVEGLWDGSITSIFRASYQ